MASIDRCMQAFSTKYPFGEWYAPRFVGTDYHKTLIGGFLINYKFDNADKLIPHSPSIIQSERESDCLLLTIVSGKSEMDLYQLRIYSNGRFRLYGVVRNTKQADGIVKDILIKCIAYLNENSDTFRLNKGKEIDLEDVYQVYTITGRRASNAL